MNKKTGLQNSDTGMSQDNDFSVNPFRTLNPRLFPEKRSASVTIPYDPSGDQEKIDSELFLSALSRPDCGKNSKKEKGFQLSEQCVLPQIKKTCKKRAEKIMKSPDINVEEKEADEFLLAMRNTRPLSGKGRQIAPGASPISPAPAQDPGFAALLAGKLEFALLYTDEYLEGRVSDLDDLLMNRLKAGQLSPEGHVDLHGFNANQAFEELKFFVRDAWYKGLRVILVVTGRGLNSPAGQGVLRRKVQNWLTQEPFKRVVLAFCTALPQDGGPGSIYVLLRRFRKKGRICWDRMPADADLY